MSIFLDTSVILKLYFPETDSEIYRARLRSESGTVYASELARIEFVSASYKKVRVKAATVADADTATHLFRQDTKLYEWIGLSPEVIHNAERLAIQYHAQGLRSLDAIQLACALQVRPQADLFLTADQRLAAVFEQEGLATR